MLLLPELSLLRSEVVTFTKALRADAALQSAQNHAEHAALIEAALRVHLKDAHPRTRLIAFAAAAEICPPLALARLNDAQVTARDCRVLRALFWSTTRRLQIFGWFSPTQA